PQTLALGRALQDGNDQVVLAHATVVLELDFLGEQVQFGQDLRVQLPEAVAGLARRAVAAVTSAALLAVLAARRGVLALGAIVRVVLDRLRLAPAPGTPRLLHAGLGRPPALTLVTAVRFAPRGGFAPRRGFVDDRRLRGRDRGRRGRRRGGLRVLARPTTL